VIFEAHFRQNSSFFVPPKTENVHDKISNFINESIFLEW